MCNCKGVGGWWWLVLKAFTCSVVWMFLTVVRKGSIMWKPKIGIGVKKNIDRVGILTRCCHPSQHGSTPKVNSNMPLFHPAHKIFAWKQCKKKCFFWYLPVKAELDSYPKEDHQGGNACQRIHPLCLFSTSTVDLKDGLVLVLNTRFSTYRCIAHWNTFTGLDDFR